MFIEIHITFNSIFHELIGYTSSNRANYISLENFSSTEEINFLEDVQIYILAT